MVANLSIPSFSNNYIKGQNVKPKIHVLAVKDKSKLDKPVIAYIVVERTEKAKSYNDGGQIYEASITLSYQLIQIGITPFRTAQSFQGGYSDIQNQVSLSSVSAGNGAIFLDLQGLCGQRIGTYLMNEIVMWAKQWPDANVNPIRLSIGQATTDNKDRRNKFYESFGLEFIYSDSDKKEGTSKPIKVKELKENLKWQKNIEVIEMMPFIENLMSNLNKQQLDLVQSTRAIERLGKENQFARSHPFKWLVKSIWYNNTNYFILLILIIAIGLVVWIRY